MIAEIEVRMQAFPTPVINEIRAFNDHIARCYHENMSDDKISKEIDKAERHVVRIILDCYKYLIICLDDHLKDFENISRNIDLTKIDNGLFYPKYSLLKKESKDLVFIAKKAETIDSEDSFVKYETAYNKYCELESLIHEVNLKVNHLRIKYPINRTKQSILWILSLIGTSILSVILTNFFNTIINK